MSNRQGNTSVSQSMVWSVFCSPQSTTAPGRVSAWAVVVPGSPTTAYLGCHVVRNTESWLTTSLYWSTRIAANLRMGSMLWSTYRKKTVQINHVREHSMFKSQTIKGVVVSSFLTNKYPRNSSHIIWIKSAESCKLHHSTTYSAKVKSLFLQIKYIDSILSFWIFVCSFTWSLKYTPNAQIYISVSVV